MLTWIDILQLLIVWSLWEVFIRKEILYHQMRKFYERAATDGTKEHKIIGDTYATMAGVSKTIIGGHVKHVLDGWMGRQVRDTETVLDDIDDEIQSNGVQHTIDGATVMLSKVKPRSKTADSILQLIEGIKMMGPMNGNDGNTGGNGGRVR